MDHCSHDGDGSCDEKDRDFVPIWVIEKDRDYVPI